MSPNDAMNMEPLLLTPITGKFCDNTLESGRLKTVNIKSWKPITYRNGVS